MNLQQGESDAETLYNLGEALKHNKTCGCQTCAVQDRRLRSSIKSETIELATMWYDFCQKHSGISLKALVDGWSKKQIAEAMNLAVR